MIVSFAWTTPALLAGAKTVTRRDWTAEYAARFRAGHLVDAWDRSPRTGKGRKVATISLTCDPYQQMSDALHPLEYRDEGFLWLDAHGHRETIARIVDDWHDNARLLWVVRFELVRVEVAGPQH